MRHRAYSPWSLSQVCTSGDTICKEVINLLKKQKLKFAYYLPFRTRQTGGQLKAGLAPTKPASKNLIKKKLTMPRNNPTQFNSRV